MANSALLDDDAIHNLFETSFLDNDSDKSNWESDDIIHHGYQVCKQLLTSPTVTLMGGDEIICLHTKLLACKECHSG